jgi:hypothetical protein
LQRYAFLVYITSVPEVLEGIFLAMKGGDHPQARGAAIHGVVLVIEWKWLSVAREKHSIFGLLDSRKVIKLINQNRVVLIFVAFFKIQTTSHQSKEICKLQTPFLSRLPTLTDPASES